MGLIAAAMRIAAVRALATEGATIVTPDRVFDSTILPIDQLATVDTPTPFISVATEDESDTPAGRDFQTGNRTVLLVIETGIAKVVPLEGEDGVGIVIQTTDANLELSLAILARQINACLWGRGGGVWGDAFRALASNVKDWDNRRGVPAQSGQRFAARQTLYLIQPVAEPPFDTPVEAGTPLAKFFEAADNDPAVLAQAAILRRAIEGKPVGWPEVYTPAAVAAGLTEIEAAAIGIVTLGDPPETVTIRDADSGDVVLVVNEAAIDAQLPEEP